LAGEAGKAGAPGKIGPASVALYAAFMSLFVYGLTTFGQHTLSYVTLAAGIAFLFLYIRHESRTDVPIIELRIFRKNPDFTLSNLAALFNYASTFAVSYMLALYLQLVKDFGEDVTGFLLIFQPIVMVVMAPIAGRLSDRRSPFVLASLGMGICSAGLFLFIFIGPQTPIWYIIAALVVVGFGFGMFSPPNTNAVMSSVEPRDFGIASSVQGTARTLGQVIGMALITIIANLFFGRAKFSEVSQEALQSDMKATFILFAALCAVGVFISLGGSLGRRSGAGRKPEGPETL
jgi:predicted MFS family arabinose efflux permease